MIRKETQEFYRENTDPEIFKREVERLKDIGYKVIEENEDYACLYEIKNCD